MEKKYWEDKEYAYFSHKKCEYFPCHKGADPEDFNCLFCYCPLYALGDKCGGNFKYNEKGFKDCTNCQLPHKKKNFSESFCVMQNSIGILQAGSFLSYA